ncbi:hypothetical protein IQ269_11330 [Tychonema sp. LEGE 07199]|uniref:hypothetical protein n=1 Tax=unclassified Tychonema TaxID=2642144 RepID=UPI001881AC59|nr:MULTISPECIES: hypothetical protein [unclassified Tychonema]MBE9121373.1 hypothetical protein [Tychonema sp. LEGE 07199]MBE9133667.1 hypothetical protein [Tychonema sp. LEGE 07196]
MIIIDKFYQPAQPLPVRSYLEPIPNKLKPASAGFFMDKNIARFYVRAQTCHLTFHRNSCVRERE